jgi:aldose 1-epimerase
MQKRNVFLTILAALCVFGTADAQKKEITKMTIQKFGNLKDGREVRLFTLTNTSGMQVSISEYGAAVTSLLVSDKNGKREDVVLGYDSLAGYEIDNSYFGVIAGRYGNRIGKGKFTLEGKEYQLTINDGENHLHGGKIGFNKVLWSGKDVSDDAGRAVELTYISKDGEEGYPGTVTLKVTYTLTDKNELKIAYVGTTDKTTIMNPTHHSYFNLSGNFNNTILDHQLMIDADAMTPVDKGLITIGKFLDVTNTPMDFRKPTAIGARINEKFEQLMFGLGYDHNWVLNHFNGKLNKVAEVYEAKSGRVMDVFTDQPGLQFYSGNFLNGSAKGKGTAFQYRTGLCLEAQCFPDSPNKPEWPSVTLRPGQVYHQITVYQFSTK